MKINLYKHNAEAYNAAVHMLREFNRAAVIHPTGTGKSFVAFKLCSDNPCKNICWLSPSEYIFKTQLENLRKVTGGYTPENISFFTYAKLMNMKDDEMKNILPDYIVLDEFHRCGAEMWGRGVKKLIELHPKAPILGLSATAVRYLDNRRNMSDELFDGNIASEISLGEAIVRGIIEPPKYVLSAFSCQKDLDKYKKRVACAKNMAVRDEGEKYLDALKRALNRADGLDDIFDKHMTERTGKYIIFCADYEHMCQMKALTGEWFYKVDKNPHVYSLYTEDPSANKEFEAFKADCDNTHLRLLYCIDALNEGVHIDDVNGVILLRPTVSPIIYKQQIGRAFQAGKNNSAVIFDIVLNIENLYSIGSIEEEMQVAISYYRSHNMENEIVNEKFKITDEVKDCIEIFDKLNEALSAPWEYMYSEAEAYYRQNGNLDVPKHYKTENGHSLGSWILTQRRVYAGAINGVLTKERVDKLNKIGMAWESRRDTRWKKYFSAAKEYSQKYKNLNVPAAYVTNDGLKLGIWISNLRTAKKNGYNSKYLNAERIAQLDEIGMVWETADYVWQRYYGACLTYHGINGNLDVPCRYITGDGIRLGSWINNIRAAYKSGCSRLSEEQISALNALGIVWDDKQEKAWNNCYKAAQTYFETHGDLNVPAAYKTKNGVMLGKWIDRQRRNKSITEDRRARLNNIGMIWKKENSWNMRFELARAYFEENGTYDIPTNYVINGIWLGKWLSEQRKKYRNGKLQNEYVQRLESAGVIWARQNAGVLNNYPLRNDNLGGCAV